MRTRRRRHWTAIALVVALGLAGIAALGSVAAQAAPADERLVSADPRNNTPRVLDGRVWAVVRIGSTVVVGGNFTQVQEANNAAPVLDQPSLFAFDAATGAIHQNFRPVLNGQVRTLAAAADGTSVYVGGDFSRINGAGPTRLQQLSLATGTKAPTYKGTPFSSGVYDVKLAGDRLYVAGSFATVGGVARPALATLNATTGALTGVVDVSVAGVNYFGTTTVRKIDVTPAGDRLVMIGNFNSVSGQSRPQIAVLNTSGPTATLAPWATSRFPNECSTSFDSYMRDVDLSPDGSFFVVVTTGAYRAGKLCDTATRWETYASESQLQPTWVDYSGGDTFWAVEVTGPIAYVGGHFRWMNNPFAADRAGAGAVPREGLAALDTRNGLPFTWNPTRTRGVGVFDFFVTDSEIWATSDTSIWANEYRPRLAAFPFGPGLPALPADRTGTIPGDVMLLDSDKVTGADQELRFFDGSSTVSAVGGPGVENWSEVRGAFMVNDTVYTGWADGTLKARTFDGASFGPVRTVPLYSNVELYGTTSKTPGYGSHVANDLPKMTGMFFDRTDGRLYYTMTNDSNLYYRYFTPESEIVGAQRFIATGGSLFGANTARDMFLVGDQLYYSDRFGDLRRITFSGGVVSGPSVLVEATKNWHGRGLFLSTAPTVTGPNTGPQAQLTAACTGLSCTFDGSASSDPDGFITNYQWTFGDGTAGSGPSASRTYTAPGTYTVALTVTDNRGATATKTQQVTVAPVPSTIAFRTSDQYSGGSLRTHNWAVPQGVNSGDTMLLFVSGITTNTPSTPDGWTPVGDGSDGTRTLVYQRVAGAAEAGRPITVTWRDANGDTKSTRTVMALAAYAGVAGVPVVAGVGELSSKAVAAHTTPAVAVPADGSWVVSYWSDKNSSTTDWVEPQGQQVRAEVGSTASPRVTGLLTDDGTATVAGNRPGLTAVADGTTTVGTFWTVVLAGG